MVCTKFYFLYLHRKYRNKRSFAKLKVYHLMKIKLYGSFIPYKRIV